MIHVVFCNLESIDYFVIVRHYEYIKYSGKTKSI